MYTPDSIIQNDMHSYTYKLNNYIENSERNKFDLVSVVENICNSNTILWFYIIRMLLFGEVRLNVQRTNFCGFILREKKTLHIKDTLANPTL